MQFADLYQPLSDDASERAQKIKLLICDIDGVFSDGRIYLGNQGEELKAFNTKDGFGIKALINSGFEVAVITGRHSQIVQQRMTSLTVPHIYQGQENKLQAYQQLKDKLQLSDEQIAYIGDDGPDLPVMELVGFAVAVNDAHPLIKRVSHYTTMLPGGFGAVRELTDLLMLENGKSLTSEGTSS
ncbi:MAG: 3-deoxy-D-manno-octulosonate 8-phosphate phosphatase (KDO 8-P phosphatase) [Pseudoalteromonas rhizosphaerae]|jgi:3-deoxy-D-manno-octulosonate 8-phosphate phosphatase (KDO 8-P phosphatase)|uniref:3-deoxy-D-manno-octulosonate 8-phosphate phosphatase KdsC n=1 Tax=Pseudoalteromonas neustonica TaxID=1840331 RepID=A0ABY3FF66_9GAMM|nr:MULTISPECIES: 3-deoxy-manno-octulosonate-8-phosphatase KdsC [Pseudoalteromonas]MBB1295322.1 3-deoxy-manno-octulosonate-8-phosphatase KdsC [Pseudoalteromonas sp. SR41-4]MBB1303312.1 3-deoxy-manno-octulosonate-8-phosphatase KdsC [Pseudoalteromonas sp. SR44-8]MBB1411571.1 3-deoxy-manno-octulosonate-8-phosphatase KdsC [Pseudoalteromonas sp. SG44-17]MBB1507898.1 3-deoxy-manno-octulosonate-8-phosphatase KdsC [Pseudoalteromonas sp. SG41-1]TVU83877.1 3-deoxy-manno-octulosonate-8-phosphatase KdsC [P|tara:strand:+ start:2563 stop:3114 length:552 start_codon:yes stop_codon:yes gene_type:complete